MFDSQTIQRIPGAREMVGFRTYLTDSLTALLTNETGGPIEFMSIALQNTSSSAILVRVELVKPEESANVATQIIHTEVMADKQRSLILLPVLNEGEAIWASAGTTSVINMFGAYLKYA